MLRPVGSGVTYRFDKTEVPQFEVDHRHGSICVACCDGPADLDYHTGLCRPCWRIVVLGPSMESMGIEAVMGHHLETRHGE